MTGRGFEGRPAPALGLDGCQAEISFGRVDGRDDTGPRAGDGVTQASELGAALAGFGGECEQLRG